MLFETVDGLELQPIYLFLSNEGPMSETELQKAFVPRQKEDGSVADKANFKKACNFLKTTGLIEKREDGKLGVIPLSLPFRLALLERLRAIHRGDVPAEHELDPFYLGLIEKLFIQPARYYVPKLHSTIAEANIPNVNETKVGTWRKVMQSLGLGLFDKKGGFFFTLPDDLICEILREWQEERSDLQSFLELHVSRFLPYATSEGDLSAVFVDKFAALQEKGIVELFTKQDSPTRIYSKYHWREIRVNKERLS